MTSLKSKARGRPRGFAEDAALDACLETFWRQGYRGTSLDDLVARTGASRASLYKTFGDKRTLLVRSLDAYAGRFEARVEALLALGLDRGETLRRLLTASVDRLTGGEAPPGCLRCNTMLEMGGEDAVIDAALEDANARFLATVRRVLDARPDGGGAGEARAGEDALLLTATVAGLVTLARSGHPRADLMAVTERVLATLSGPDGAPAGRDGSRP